jgi:hypothetical protein
MIGSVFSSAISGIHTGMNSLARSGQEIARANIPAEEGGTEDLAPPLVEQIEGKTQVQASARVVEAGSATLGSLLDIEV